MSRGTGSATARRAEWLQAPALAWWGGLLLLAFVLRLPVFLIPFSNGDEATYTALANALLDGRAMYVGAVDHKPPLMAVTYAGIYLAAGRCAIHWVHAFSVVVVALTGILLARAGRSLGLAARDARLAGVAWLVFASIGPAGDALAANGEIFMLLPSVAAIALAARPRPPGSAGDLSRWLAAGALASIAVLYKYQAAAIGLPLALLACRQTPFVPGLLRLGCLAAGFACPLAAFIGWYLQAGQMESLRLWAWTFPRLYSGMLTAAESLRNLGRALLVWGGGCVALLLAAGRSVRRGKLPEPVPAVAAAWIAGAAIGVSAGGRFSPHYFLQLLPPLCLLAPPALGAALDRPGWWRRLLAFSTAVPLGGFFTLNALGQPTYPQLAQRTRVYRDVGRYLDSHAAPADTVFVWGNSPEIYYFSRRAMGTRFPFCNYHSGKIWGTAADQEGAVVPPGHVFEPAWTLLLQDLRDRKPRWIVDAASGGLDRWTGHDVTRYPRLASAMAGLYARHTTVDGVVIYRRTSS